MLHFSLVSTVARFNSMYTYRVLAILPMPAVLGISISYGFAVSGFETPVGAALSLFLASTFMVFLVVPWAICSNVSQACADLPRRAMLVFQRQGIFGPLFDKSYTPQLPPPADMDRLVHLGIDGVTNKLQLSNRYLRDATDFVALITSDRPSFGFSLGGEVVLMGPVQLTGLGVLVAVLCVAAVPVLDALISTGERVV